MDLTWLWQGIVSNAAYGLIAGGIVIMVTVLKKRHSVWLSPVLYGLMTGLLALMLLYSGAMFARWPLLTIAVLCVCVIAAVGLHITSTYTARKPESHSRSEDALDAATKGLGLDLDPVRLKYLIDNAERQGDAINRWVVVEKCEFGLHELARTNAYMEFVFSVRNGSIFNVKLSLSSHSEAVFFGKWQLIHTIQEKEDPDEMLSGSSGVFVIQQTLGPDDVKHVLGDVGTFTFPRLKVFIRAAGVFDSAFATRRLSLDGIEVSNDVLLNAYKKPSA